MYPFRFAESDEYDLVMVINFLFPKDMANSAESVYVVEFSRGCSAMLATEPSYAKY